MGKPAASKEPGGQSRKNTSLSVARGEVPSRTSNVPVPELIDVTASTKIEFQHLSSPDERYIVESMSGGVALIDYDRDGWPDIYFTNAQNVEMARTGKKARSALYHNNHDGTFTDVTDKAGVGYPCWAMGAVVGDYNNDGWPDLLVTCFNGVVLYRNNGDGTFTDVTKQAGLDRDAGWATGAAFGDYDGDGWVDLFVPHYVKLSLGDLPVFGSSRTCRYHEIDVQCGPRGLPGSPDSLYRNNHDGTFTDVSKKAAVDDPQGLYGLEAVWWDSEHRGLLDLFVANDSGPNYLYKNNGDGTFTDVSYPAGTAVSEEGAEQANMGIALGDYNHTERQSIFITHFAEDYAVLYRNEGKWNFTDVSYAAGVGPATRPYVGFGDAFLDLDNDGWLDLFVVNGHIYPQVDGADMAAKYREPKLLFMNRHDGTFMDASKMAGSAIQIPQVSRGVAVGDLFNNGSLDLVVENLEGAPTILQPRNLSNNHWISLQLEANGGDKLALNARVKVTTVSDIQIGEVLSGGSYLSQNDLRIHFGLGEQKVVGKVEITWPDHSISTYQDIAANRFYYVKQGDSALAVDTRISPDSHASGIR
jgi:hypothetical protein